MPLNPESLAQEIADSVTPFLKSADSESFLSLYRGSLFIPHLAIVVAVTMETDSAGNRWVSLSLKEKKLSTPTEKLTDSALKEVIDDIPGLLTAIAMARLILESAANPRQ